MDDLCLFRIDLGFAGATRHWPVAVGLTASDAAVCHDTCHPAPDLVLQVGQEEGRDQASDADLDRIGPAVMHGDDVDARKGQPLVDAREVFLVAAETI
ncbi:hypothetical protein OU682_14700 [Paracoccus sp. EF6]|uniref:Uncharacterized protein n=1 Tax=Paracoccus benzoatiresistens TaxID=2997341 RepID=A0ABT4J703_9RHOB|nr:hypothetical protein [Paracoccus sp. EF6]MCZ0962867.1 hypothetical protein [Paracoccus sp. EF6]